VCAAENNIYKKKKNKNWKILFSAIEFNKFTVANTIVNQNKNKSKTNN